MFKKGKKKKKAQKYQSTEREKKEWGRKSKEKQETRAPVQLSTQFLKSRMP